MNAKSLHPIIAQMEPSPEQRGPITRRDSDVVVSAGAGTGKTRTLVARFLSLLAEGLPLRSITAITFTIKASREMRNRLREEVRKYLERQDLPPEELNRWQNIYSSLDAARVSTIHSLCAEILRTHPAEMGLDPRFEMLDEGQAAVLQASTVNTALSWAAEQGDTGALFSTFGEWNLRKMLAELLNRRLDVGNTQPFDPQGTWEIWERILTAPMEDFLDHPEVQRCFRALGGLKQAGILASAAEAGDALAPYLRQVLFHWEIIQQAKQGGDWREISRHLPPLRESLKQKGRKANWDPAEPKKIISELQGYYDQILAVFAAQPVDLDLDQQLVLDVLPALHRVVEQAVTIYDRLKKRKRALDFDDLEHNALILLRDFPTVRRYWQGIIQALLVDEFQDTNARQRDILELLNGDEQSLFIVGDGKQSIYRFRGADVAVFREEKGRITKQGQAYELNTSYRTHPGLLSLLNNLLEPVLGEEDPEKPYIEPFAPLEPARKSSAEGFHPPFVEFHLTVGKRGQGALDQAAAAAVERIFQLVEQAEIRLKQPDSQSERPLNYGDFAVLCRASSSFGAYEQALEARGIPYLTFSGSGFYDRPEVRDALNFLKAAGEPGDNLALVGSLRSPVGGLSDLALYRLREAQSEREAATLWEVLTSDDLAFLEGEEPTAIRIRDLIMDLNMLIGRQTVAAVIKEFLDRTHYRAGLIQAGLQRGVDNLNKLLRDAQNSGLVSLTQFLNYIQQLRDSAVREGEAPAVAEGAVQLMTVHQVKGLEFPVVVIGDASKSSRQPSGVILDDELGLVPPFKGERVVEGMEGQAEKLEIQSSAYLIAKEREKERDDAESARLLYVAATRAREMLLISGCLRNINKDGTFSKPQGWLEQLGRPFDLGNTTIDFQWNGTGFQDLTEVIGGEALLCRIYEQNWSPVLPDPVQSRPDQMQPPAGVRMLEEIVKPLVSNYEEEEDFQIWRVVPDQDRLYVPQRVIGSLFHRAVERWIFPDTDSRDFTAWAGAELQRMGMIDETLIRKAIKKVERLLDRFQRSPIYQELEQADIRRMELPYSIKVDQVVKTKRIDLIYSYQGEWRLLDFKTDRIQDRSSLAEVLPDYQSQVTEYQDALETFLGTRPRAWIVFLDLENDIEAIAVN